MLRFRYQTIEFGKTDVHLRTLRDRQQFSDADGIASDLGISSANWSLFGVVWASGEILARLMHGYDITGKRILEVGCGIGLASLVLHQRSADITATDYHPEAEGFLLENAELNNLGEIPFVRTGWDDEISGLGEFDIIIGSDLLYEKEHADLLAAFIDQHSRRYCKVIIIDPGRKHYSRFSKNMMSRGYTYEKKEPDDMDNLTQPIRGVSRFRVLYYDR